MCEYFLQILRRICPHVVHAASPVTQSWVSYSTCMCCHQAYQASHEVSLSPAAVQQMTINIVNREHGRWQQRLQKCACWTQILLRTRRDDRELFEQVQLTNQFGWTMCSSSIQIINQYYSIVGWLIILVRFMICRSINRLGKWAIDWLIATAICHHSTADESAVQRMNSFCHIASCLVLTHNQY